MSISATTDQFAAKFSQLFKDSEKVAGSINADDPASVMRAQSASTRIQMAISALFKMFEDILGENKKVGGPVNATQVQ